MNKAESRRLRKHSLYLEKLKGPRRDVIIHMQMPGVRGMFVLYIFSCFSCIKMKVT